MIHSLPGQFRAIPCLSAAFRNRGETSRQRRIRRSAQVAYTARMQLPRLTAPVSALALALTLVACGSVPPSPDRGPHVSTRTSRYSEKGIEVTLFALGLIDTGYLFGGKNPEAGLDCSGMVSFIYDKAAGLEVRGSAADIARRGQSIARDDLRPGDLVFFNTLGRSFSHVGVYIGNDRFVHAPSSGGRVRIDELGARYYARHFEAARSYFD